MGKISFFFGISNLEKISDALLRILSVFLSAFTTISPVSRQMRLEKFIKGRHPGTLVYVCKIALFFVHTLFAITVVFLSLMFFHEDKRWDNLRQFYLDQYGELLCSFAIGAFLIYGSNFNSHAGGWSL